MSTPPLFPDADVTPVRRKKRTQCTGDKPPCRLCGARPPKPRSVMPLTHAMETVQGILIDRLDSTVDDLVQIITDEAAEHIDNARIVQRIAGRIIDAINWRLFPDAYQDGEPYTPDPAGRIDTVPAFTGLVPRLPTMAIYAKHLLEVGQRSPAVQSLPGVFTQSDLIRLGERIGRREAGR